MLHSGEAVQRYSIPYYNYRTASPSFDLGFPPDINQGYGQLRLSNVLPLPTGYGLPYPLKLFVWDAVNVTERSVWKWEVDIGPSLSMSYLLQPLKVTVAWYDPPAAFASAAVLLLHDIDLVVVTPTGDIWWGNTMLSGDYLNPNEQIYIPHAMCYRNNCKFSIYVKAHTFPERTWQTLAVVVTAAGKSL